MDGYGDDWPVEEPRGSLRRWMRWVVVGVVALAVGTGGGALAGALRPPDETRWLTATLPGATTESLIALDPSAARPNSNGLATRLTGLLADKRLGGRVTASVVDVATGERLFGSGQNSAVIPASTNKLLTAAAVLATLGPDYRIPTRAVAGARPGEVVIVGSGDLTLGAGEVHTYPGAGRLDLLAEQVRESLGGQTPTRVVVDSSLFPGPVYSPNWFPQDRDGGFIADITALMTDGARRDPARPARGYAPRYKEPDLAAGRLFAEALGLPASAVDRGTAPANAEPLGEVFSPPIGRLVEIMLIESDNVLAEGLARQVAVARGEPASFAGAGEATRDALAELGLPVDGLVMVDGSGLSHDDRASADLLTQVLALASSDDHPELRPIVSGLPVAGYSGTLDDRGGVAGIVRAKTGTLTGVNTLAGLVVTVDGRLLAFSVLADRTEGSARPVETAIDKIAAELARCGCQ